MLFKKKKKEEKVEMVENPFSQIDASSLEQDEVKIVTDVPISNFSEKSNDDVIDNVNDDQRLNVIETVNNNINEDFNEIHPVKASDLESIANIEIVDFKNMNVDDLIKDIEVEEYCPNCGSKISKDSDVCFICGTSIN